MALGDWVQYEWDVERTVQVNGDLDIDHHHCATYAECLRVAAGEPNTSIVLVRDDQDGRSWAYVTDGALPAEFTQPDEHGAYVSIGIKVPKRFHREVAK